MTDSQDRGAAQSLIICSDPTPAEIVGGPLDAALLCHGKSLCCRHCFVSQIAAAEAERAKAQDEHVRQMTEAYVDAKWLYKTPIIAAMCAERGDALIVGRAEGQRAGLSSR